jgi:hypothetical protein
VRWLGSRVSGLGNRRRGRRREECYCTKQGYGNSGRADIGNDFGFHSAFGDLLVLNVPSEDFDGRGKKSLGNLYWRPRLQRLNG